MVELDPAVLMVEGQQLGTHWMVEVGTHLKAVVEEQGIVAAQKVAVQGIVLLEVVQGLEVGD